jgi:hypothetical protein
VDLNGKILILKALIAKSLDATGCDALKGVRLILGTKGMTRDEATKKAARRCACAAFRLCFYLYYTGWSEIICRDFSASFSFRFFRLRGFARREGLDMISQRTVAT